VEMDNFTKKVAVFDPDDGSAATAFQRISGVFDIFTNGIAVQSRQDGIDWGRVLQSLTEQSEPQYDGVVCLAAQCGTCGSIEYGLSPFVCVHTDNNLAAKLARAVTSVVSGGSVIVRLLGSILSYAATREVFFTVARWFGNITFVKPIGSRLCTDEVYLVLSGYTGPIISGDSRACLETLIAKYDVDAACFRAAWVSQVHRARSKPDHWAVLDAVDRFVVNCLRPSGFVSIMGRGGRIIYVSYPNRNYSIDVQRFLMSEGDPIVRPSNVLRYEDLGAARIRYKFLAHLYKHRAPGVRLTASDVDLVLSRFTWVRTSLAYVTAYYWRAPKSHLPLAWEIEPAFLQFMVDVVETSTVPLTNQNIALAVGGISAEKVGHVLESTGLKTDGGRWWGKEIIAVPPVVTTLSVSRPARHRSQLKGAALVESVVGMARSITDYFSAHDIVQLLRTRGLVARVSEVETVLKTGSFTCVQASRNPLYRLRIV